MARTVLLTLGRLPKALDLARALAGAGCRVLVAEPLGWHMCRMSKAVARSFRVPAPFTEPAGYRAAMAEIIAAQGVDLVVPVTDETLHLAAMRDAVPPHVRLFTGPLAKMRALHDKRQFIATARDHGLSAPETHTLGSPEAAGLAERHKVVVKPIYTNSGKGLQILDQGAPLPPADPATPKIVQAFLPGRVLSTFSVAHAGVVRGTVVYQGLVFSGTVAVCFERIESPAVAAWVQAFVGAEHYSGFIAFDFIEAADGTVQAIECNPRTTSGLHFVAPACLARAILAPEDEAPWRMRPETRLQQFYSCLTESRWGWFARRARQRDAGEYLLKTKDVSWSAADPWPFLTMTATAFPILWQAVRAGVPLGEVATADLAWTEEAAADG